MRNAQCTLKKTYSVLYTLAYIIMMHPRNKYKKYSAVQMQTKGRGIKKG